MKSTLLLILLASLLLTACGGGGGSSNVAPIASNDSINIVENITFELNVIDNDTDSDGNLDISSITIQTSPTQGIATVNTTTGNISFVPNTDYTGTDSFSYSLKDDDGEESNQATVTITIDGDVDNDGIGDLSDTDNDNDGISDIDEQANGTDPLNKDSDNDGIEDNIEGTTDTDNDGTIDALEAANLDVDNDGVFDQEDSENVNPNNDSDGDGDGFSNVEESFNETDPLKSNSIPTPFIFEVKATAGLCFTGGCGSSYTIKTRPNYEYDYSVDCDGDGTMEGADLNNEFTCNYFGHFESHTISIHGQFPVLNFKNDDTLLSVDQWGTIPFQSMNRAFEDARSMEINADDKPNLKKVSDMSFMFAGSSINHYISNWDVSSVTNMSSMFREAHYFNQDLSSWDVSSVSDMSFMFNGFPRILPVCACVYGPSNFNQDLSLWNVSNVTNMTGMLDGVGLSAVNYEKLLISWSSLNLQSNVIFGAGGLNYGEVAANARQIIIDLYNWEINDAGISP